MTLNIGLFIFNIAKRLFITEFKSVLPFNMSKMHKHNRKGECTILHSSSVRTNVGFDTLPTPVKSASDNKEYKVIKLKNGLVACLISDVTNADVQSLLSDSESEDDTESEYSESDKESNQSLSEAEESDEDYKMKKVPSFEEKMAAAALSIGVGNFSDPKDVPGLAHFLEHMVFMGSEKFPQENNFDSFLKKRGGTSNASTDAEVTTFYFECLEKHLQRSLDKFAQFFIAPLLKKETMTREREAIESEFQMALPSDTYRKEQLMLSLFNLKVPINEFSWGNLKTLKDNIEDDVLYQKLHEFRKRHYSAHRMTLAIQARLPMDVLQSYILESFSDIPSNNLPPNDFTQYANIIFDNPKFNKMYYVQPMKDVIQVNLTWQLPSLLRKYKSKPHHYLSCLLGDEGKGSLLSYLKQKVWGFTVFAGSDESGSDHNSMYTLFTVTISLTNEGLKNLFEVITAVYSYINLLKMDGPHQRLYEEFKLIEDTSFKFTDEKNAVEMVEDLAEAMQFYLPEDYLTGSDLYLEYDPEGIKLVLSHLSVEKMNILVLSPHLPENIKYDKIEPWFNISYTAQDIPQEWIEKWNSVLPYENFILPPPNNYLTNDFTILPDISDNPEYPEKILELSEIELWYRKDQKFKLPVAYYCYYFISPLIFESPLNACMTDMFISFFALQLNEELYPASVAELNFSVSVADKGIVINVYGYNEKLPILIEVVMKYLIDVSKNLSAPIFEAVKEARIKAYYNRFSKPSNLAKEVRLSLLIDNFWTSLDKYNAISDVSIDMVREFSEKLVKKFYIQGLIQGNVDKETAIKTTRTLIDILNCEILSLDAIPKIRVRKVPEGEHCCRLMSFNKNNSNSIITNYYQSEPFSLKTNVIIDFLMTFIEEPLFDILRTKEQLGYYVFCSVRDTFGILGYSITVNTQATKNTAHHVDSRIESFIKHTNKLLKNMNDKRFNQLKRDLIKVKMCSDIDLKEEVNRNWSEITTREFIFDRLKQEIKSIEELRISEIKHFWEMHNIFGNKNKSKKLTVQVVGYKVDESPKDAQQIVNKKLSPRFLRKAGVVHENNTDKLLESTQEHYSLEYVGKQDGEAETKTEDYFITNIEEFRNKLKLFQ